MTFVAVLDVNSSMLGMKLNMLIVSFSSTAQRPISLPRMSNEGVQLALNVVDSLIAGGVTNIAEGIRKGAKVFYFSYLLISLVFLEADVEILQNGSAIYWLKILHNY